MKLPNGTIVMDKTGAGRNCRAPAKIPDVDTLPCPARDGTHHIELTRAGVARCKWCFGTWADLDAIARGTR